MLQPLTPVEISYVICLSCMLRLAVLFITARVARPGRPRMVLPRYVSTWPTYNPALLACCVLASMACAVLCNIIKGNSEHYGPSWVQLVDSVNFTWSCNARDLTDSFYDDRVQYRSVDVLLQPQTALKSALQALYPAQPKDSCVLTSGGLCWVCPACVSCCMQ